MRERERQSTERGMLSSASLPLSSCDCNVAPARDSERKTSSFQAKRNFFFFLRFSGERHAASSVAGDDSTTSERESLRGVWRRTVGLVEGIRDPLHSRSQGARETFAYSLNQKRAPAAVAHQQTESESRWHTYTQRQTVGRGRAKERAREREMARKRMMHEKDFLQKQRENQITRADRRRRRRRESKGEKRTRVEDTHTVQ